MGWIVLLLLISWIFVSIVVVLAAARLGARSDEISARLPRHSEQPSQGKKVQGPHRRQSA